MKKLSYVLLGLVILFFSCKQEGNKMRRKWSNLEHADINLWADDYFHQNTVDASRVREGIIRARVDGEWHDYKTVELPDKFIKWSVENRMETFERVRKNQMPRLAGPHNGMVATYGIRRLDSQFKINNAVKGMGFMPKEDKIKEVIDLLESTKDSDFETRLKVLEDLYNHVDEYFTRKALLSLELYTTKEFETHTFLNEMVNPAASIVFLDIPSFEVKAIAQLIHPNDPQLTEYEEDIVHYANLIHSYFHGKFTKTFIAVVYHVIEVYDNTPGRGGKGIRIMPPLP